MREIKFRAYDSFLKKMLDSEYVKEFRLSALPYCKVFDSLNEHDCFFMQCTGINDKNGIEIYEGDIVCFEEPSFESEILKCPVIFYDGTFALEHGKIRYPLWNFEPEWESLEVIGNIHENEELLK